MKNHMLALVQWVDREQAWFYLLGLGLGAVVGLSVPAVAPVAETTIVPLLALLLYATFLGVPFNCFRSEERRVGKELRFEKATYLIQLGIWYDWKSVVLQYRDD